jgi:hypothetical protein
MMYLMAGGARTSASGSFRARLRDAYGGWAILQASPLIGGDDDQVAVAIEPASGDQLLGLLFAAYGLTARERDLCREVIKGARPLRSRAASSSPAIPCKIISSRSSPRSAYAVAVKSSLGCGLTPQCRSNDAALHVAGQQREIGRAQEVARGVDLMPIRICQRLRADLVQTLHLIGR